MSADAKPLPTLAFCRGQRPKDVTLSALAECFRVLAAQLERIAEQESATGPGLRPKDVAAELGVSGPTVTRLIQTGQIKAERFGPRMVRVSRAELERYRRRRSN